MFSDLPCAGRWNAATYTTNSSSAPRDPMARRRRRSELARRPRSRYNITITVIITINYFTVVAVGRLYYYVILLRLFSGGTDVVPMRSICCRGRVVRYCFCRSERRLRSRVGGTHVGDRLSDGVLVGRAVTANLRGPAVAGRAVRPCSGSRAPPSSTATL